jgi:hypothetical protein
VPNSNDSPDISWLWRLLDVLEPTIYLSTNNASINGAFLDCALGEARRCAVNCLLPIRVEPLRLRQLTCLPAVELLFSVATLARPLRDGKRLLIYPYAEVLWNAMWGGAATSQYLNGTALEMVIMRGAMCESDTLTMSCIASRLLLQTVLNTTMQYEWLTKINVGHCYVQTNCRPRRGRSLHVGFGLTRVRRYLALRRCVQLCTSSGTAGTRCWPSLKQCRLSASCGTTDPEYCRLLDYLDLRRQRHMLRWYGDQCCWRVVRTRNSAGDICEHHAGASGALDSPS